MFLVFFIHIHLINTVKCAREGKNNIQNSAQQHRRHSNFKIKLINFECIWLSFRLVLFRYLFFIVILLWNANIFEQTHYELSQNRALLVLFCFSTGIVSFWPNQYTNWRTTKTRREIRLISHASKPTMGWFVGWCGRDTPAYVSVCVCAVHSTRTVGTHDTRLRTNFKMF